MNGRLRLGLVALAAIALVGSPLVSPASAQEASERFRVLVPHFLPEGGADDDFGEDLGDDLRGLLNEMATHQPVSRDDIEDAADDFDLDMDDLNCVRARQLASQIDSRVVLCGEYGPTDDGQYQVRGRFVVVDSDETFEVEPISVTEGERGEAARHIIEEFDRVVEQTRRAAFCEDYFGSQQYDNALENCRRAVELNPESIRSRYTLARTLQEMERPEEALEEFQAVLDLDPVHENSLHRAGGLSAELGRSEDARDYYERYLELNPDDSNVRMRVAYELAQAGDPAGAMQLIEDGLDLDPDNPALYEQYGNFAFSAAGQRLEEAGLEAQARQADEEQVDQVPQEVVELYRTAIEAYTEVLEQKGDETNPSQLRNVVAAHLQLGEDEEAVAFAEEALDIHPEEARLWSIYADALSRSGDVEEAIAALDTVHEIDPDYANVAVRQGKWLLDEGRADEAIPRLQTAVERGEQSPDVVARLILADAHSRGVQAENYDYAIEGIEAARSSFELSENVRAELDFWHAYALYQRAVQQQEPQTVETAEATLPEFRRALDLFQSSEPYATRQSSIDLNRFLEAAQQYIEIQEAIIERGGRR